MAGVQASPPRLGSVTSSPAAYDERLRVPLRWWVQATMLVASLWLAVIVATPARAAWLLTAIAAAVAVGLLLSWGSARVRVSEGWLRAGRASIEGRHLTSVTALDAEETRRTSGVDADARAYLLLRPYLKRSVKVHLSDPRDPTPYWLLSTRRPEQLAAALTRLMEDQAGADRVNHPYVQED